MGRVYRVELTGLASGLNGNKVGAVREKWSLIRQAICNWRVGEARRSQGGIYWWPVRLCDQRTLDMLYYIKSYKPYKQDCYLYNNFSLKSRN